jgi:hypothetical protein
MTDHILGNENLIKNLAVVDHKGKTDEFGNYSAPSRPGFYRLMGAGFDSFVNLGKNLRVNIRPFFKRSSHSIYLTFNNYTTNFLAFMLITPQTENVQLSVFE